MRDDVGTVANDKRNERSVLKSEVGAMTKP